MKHIIKKECDIVWIILVQSFVHWKYKLLNSQMDSVLISIKLETSILSKSPTQDHADRNPPDLWNFYEVKLSKIV